MNFIDLAPQYEKIRDNVNKRLQSVMERSQFIMGPEVKELEQKLEDYTNSKSCICVGNGTDALQLALMALELNEGDEVLVPDFSFFASVEVILLLKLKPVFVDVDQETCLIDLNNLSSKITERTKAVIAVSLYGQCPDFSKMREVIEQKTSNRIVLIEDAAQSFGSLQRDKKSCALADLACTSFFPTKPLGCFGDGGAIFTNHDELALKIKALRVHGQTKRYEHSFVGVNSRLDTMQAAVLLEKLPLVDQERELRLKASERYFDRLSKRFQCLKIESFNTPNYAQFPIFIDRRDELKEFLANRDIPTTIHYPIPMSKQPIFENELFDEGDCPRSVKVASSVLCLPFYAYITEDIIDHVCDHVLEFDR